MYACITRGEKNVVSFSASVSFNFETRIMLTCMSTSRSNYIDMSIWKKHADHSTTPRLGCIAVKILFHLLEHWNNTTEFNDIHDSFLLTLSYKRCCCNETPPMTGRNLDFFFFFFYPHIREISKLFTRNLCQVYAA